LRKWIVQAQDRIAAARPTLGSAATSGGTLAGMLGAKGGGTKVGGAGGAVGTSPAVQAASELTPEIEKSMKADSRQNEAALMLGQKRFGRAAELLREVVALEPERAEAWRALAACNQQEKKYDEALVAWNKFIGLSTDKAELAPAWLGAGICQQRLQKYPEAREALGKYVELASDESEKANAWHLIASIQLMEGKFEAAMESYKTAIECNPRGDNVGLLKFQLQALKNELGGSPKKGSPDSEDYLADTTQSRFVRWSRRPAIKVYIKDASKVAGYSPTFDSKLRAAFAEWEKASDGIVKFAFVSKPRSANIECVWTDSVFELGSPIKGGQTSTEAIGHDIEHATIQLLTMNGMTNTPITEDAAYLVALHEIGHALGLSGHSPSPNDVMFPYSGALTLSERDKKTLAALYKTKPPPLPPDAYPKVQWLH